MLEYLKNYYIFMLILMVVSFLVPKDSYKLYIQFFTGVFLLAVLLEPVLMFLTEENTEYIYDFFKEINKELEGVSFEAFISKGKGE